MAIFFADATDGLAEAAGVGLVGEVLDIGLYHKALCGALYCRI
jgi:hypothetical protein